MSRNRNTNHRIIELLEIRNHQDSGDMIVDARKVISGIENINAVNAYSLVQGRIHKSGRAIRFLKMISKGAAILFLPLLLTCFWLYYSNNERFPEPTYAFQEITSPPGMRSQVVLTDGTKVWLNAESTIKFQVPFPKEKRKVEVIGEAFFDVAKNPDQMFIVHSANVGVKVYGTRFNFKAYQEDQNIEVILEEGKVGLTIFEPGNVKKTTMMPGDHAIVERNSNKTSVKNENISRFIAWHTGKLVFDNSPMNEVAKMLERWYGIEVIISNPEIMDYRFTTTFDNESLFEVIELIELSSPIRMKYVPAKMSNDNQTHSRSKVIISKK